MVNRAKISEKSVAVRVNLGPISMYCNLDGWGVDRDALS